MNKRRIRFYIPRVKRETIYLFIMSVGITSAVLSYLGGNIEKATFWLIVSMFSYLVMTNKTK